MLFDLGHSLCRHPKLRFRGIRTSDQRSNQAQEFLLFWSVPSRDEKGSDLSVGDLATRGKIRLMPDEHPIGVRIEGEQPPIAVGAVVNLPGPNGHANCSVLHALQVGMSR
jgi:hypothetical protein